jgi:hypothetical protein
LAAAENINASCVSRVLWLTLFAPHIVEAILDGRQLDGGNPVLRRIRGDDKPIAGTQLISEYQGVEHSVTVLHDGYEYQGRPYQSLSAIARAITGTRWNGRVFFGLRPSRGAA